MATTIEDMATPPLTSSASAAKPVRKPDRKSIREKGKAQMLWKPLVFTVLLLPFFSLVFAVVSGNIGPNPIETITHITGEWSLRILMLALAITPLRLVLKKTWPVRFRRMVGLFAFFYVCLHMLTYLVLDQQLDGSAIVADLLERPYITAGSFAFLILLPLALTSTRGMVRRLGRRWHALHRLVYFAGVGAMLHYVWLAKGDLIEPTVYLVMLALLLMIRLHHQLKKGL